MPTIVCLCGSSRFKNAFEIAQRSEALKGHIVLSLPIFTKSGDAPISAAEERILGASHLVKIEMADEVLVIDVDDYIGDATRSEIEAAKSLEKPIRYWSREYSHNRVDGTHVATESRSMRSMQETVTRIRSDRGFTLEPLKLLALLVEEVGEVANELKKSWSSNYPDPDPADLANELADTFVLLNALASRFDIDLEHAVESKFIRADALRTWATERSPE